LPSGRAVPVSGRQDAARSPAPATGVAPPDALQPVPLFLPLPGAFLRGALALVAAAGLLSGLASLYLQHSDTALARLLFKGFWVNEERNFPTLVNFSLLGFACGLLVLIAATAFARRRPWRWHWLAMAAVFLLLCFDEAAGLHERLIAPMQSLTSVRGPLTYAWVVPGAAFVLLFAGAYLRFLGDLPRPAGKTMLAAGILFCSGALGMEMVGGAALDRYGTQETGVYRFATMTEELLEMTGLALFSTSLLMILNPGGSTGPR
jgi:hypothetical protein